jgi:ribosomal-protein-alanine N-acetyltransferase
MGWKQKLIKLAELHKHKLAFYCLITEKDTDRLLGTISFSNLSKFPFYACNVGYSLDEDEQGRGTMTRAIALASHWMFEEHNVHRIMAAYMPHNKKSEQVLLRNGFVKEGMAKNYLLIDGVWRDHNLTSLINDNWKESNSE